MPAFADPLNPMDSVWKGMGEPPTLPQDEGQRELELQLRRRHIYRSALPAILPVVLVPLLLHSVHPYLIPIDRMALPALLAVFLLMIAFSWTRWSLRVVDYVMVVVPSTFVTIRLACVLADPTNLAPSGTLAATLPWMIGTLLINAWILYDRPRAGVTINFVQLTLTLVILSVWWPHAALPNPERENLISALLQVVGLQVGVVAAQVLVARQSQALVRVAQQARAQALTDALTSLPNRRALMDRLNDQSRTQGTGMMVAAFIDVDHFKAVNDAHGHALGDEVLRGLADRLTAHLPAGGLVGRYGGEEFLALWHTECPNSVLDQGERWRAAVAATPIAGHAITVSIGAALCGTPLHPVRLLEVADAALYRAKDAGRNAVVTEQLGASGS